MLIRNLLWWVGYVVAAIWLQKLLPGLDAFVPGLLLCLQEKNRQQLVLYALFVIAIQEGAGTLPFGSSIMWTGIIAALFYIGGWVFMAGNLMFITVLSLALGLARFLLMQGLDSLQPLPFDSRQLLTESVILAICTPAFWFISSTTRGRILKNAH